MSSTTIRVSGTDAARAALRGASAQTRAAVSRAVARTLVQGEGRIKRTLSQPGRGRTYTRGTVTHRASAPGDPPAVDTGTYRASWRHVTEGLGTARPGGMVYTDQERGPWLEFGTRHMAARPHAAPVAAEMTGDFRENMIREVGR